MLKGLEQQATTREQRYSEGCLDDDERMLEPVASRACCTAPSFAQAVLRGNS
jgi:hypothetical protein